MRAKDQSSIPAAEDLHSEDSVDSDDSKSEHSLHGIIGRSSVMQDVFSLVEKVADSDSTIMIYGETGTGKGMIAKAIHDNSYRKDKAFVQVNCGAIPENLLESELFGHMRGAFTGATSDKPGKFERANHGTIFLDEIGDMSPDLQVKILRVLEEREFERVGGIKNIKVDVRIVAATHRNLEEKVQKGTFREDLYYRLHVIPFTLPPLRERASDIPLLVSHFMEQFDTKKKKDVQGVSNKALGMMTNYSWPGNVRELKNIVERLVVLKGEGTITPSDLPENVQRKNGNGTAPSGIELTKDGICLSTAVSDFEKALIFQSLEKTQWVKNKAAKLLHLNRTTLVEKIKRYDLQKASS